MLDCMLVGSDWIELIGAFGMSSEDDRFGLQIARNFTVPPTNEDGRNHLSGGLNMLLAVSLFGH